MRDYFTFIKRANYTKFGFYNMKVDEVIDYIKNGNLLLFDREIGQYTLQHITEFIHMFHIDDPILIRIRSEFDRMTNTVYFFHPVLL